MGIWKRLFGDRELANSEMDKYRIKENIDSSPPLSIHELIGKGDLQGVGALIKENRDLILDKTQKGDMPLHTAAFNGHANMVILLIDNGADVNARRSDDVTALFLASQEGHKDVAELLIAKNANVNAIATEDNWTSLHVAILGGHLDVVELLLANNAGVDTRDNTGGTPLKWAALNGRKDIVELLLANRAGVDNKDKNGYTALHQTAIMGHKNVAELLLASGADVNAMDDEGQTPLLFAWAKGHENVAALLLQHGANGQPLFQDQNSDTNFSLGCDALKQQNRSEAIGLFRLAAQQGHTKAKNMLGVVLLQTNSDFNEAYKWIRDAADEGNDSAIKNRETIEGFIKRGYGGALLMSYSW